MNDSGKTNSKSDASGGANTDAKSGDGINARISDSGDMDITQPGIEPDALTLAKMDAEKFKNEYLYLRAEFENYKKQAIKERSDTRKYGSERVIVDLLGVLDIFETALATELTPETIANFRKGIEMTASELRNTLQRHGVSEVPSKGQPFDPAVHEALSSEETNDVPNGTVTQVFKKPYKLHDRVVRAGQVVVAKPKS
jgi:molecular chaperone GrpE